VCSALDVLDEACLYLATSHNKENEPRCRLCDPFEDLNYERDPIDQAIYTIRYFMAYYCEAYDVYRNFFYDALGGTEKITVLSLGCGNCPDYFALKKFATRSPSHPKDYIYIGVDTGKWDYSVAEKDPGVSYYNSRNEFMEKTSLMPSFNVIVFSKSLRNIGVNNSIEYLDNVSIDKKCMLICMDIGDNNGGNRSFSADIECNHEIIEYLNKRLNSKGVRKEYSYEKDFKDSKIGEYDFAKNWSFYEGHCSYYNNQCGRQKTTYRYIYGQRYQNKYYKHNPVSTKKLYHGEVVYWG